MLYSLSLFGRCATAEKVRVWWCIPFRPWYTTLGMPWKRREIATKWLIQLRQVGRWYGSRKLPYRLITQQFKIAWNGLNAGLNGSNVRSTRNCSQQFKLSYNRCTQFTPANCYERVWTVAGTFEPLRPRLTRSCWYLVSSLASGSCRPLQVGVCLGRIKTRAPWPKIGHCAHFTGRKPLEMDLPIRERPFHYLGGGLEELFSADYFFTWCLKLDFFFTHQLKPDFFFTKNWKSDYFFIVMFQVKDIHIIFRVEARLFFLQHIKAKKFFQRTGWAKLFFWAKSSARLFFQKLFQPPPR